MASAALNRLSAEGSQDGAGPRAGALRVVSLLPSATDTLIALKMQDMLVGRSHECDMPEVSAVPALTESKLGPMEDCGVIDQAMASSKAGLADVSMWMPEQQQLEVLLSYGLGVYQTDLRKLQALRPDVLLTQVQELPGWLPVTGALQQWEEAVAACIGQRCRVVHLAANSLKEVWSDMQEVADAVGASQEGSSLIQGIQRRIQVASQCGKGRPRPRVVCVQWPEPLFAAGSWVPELIRLAGGDDVIGREDEAVMFTSEQLKQAKPEVVLFALCGFGLKAAERKTRQAIAKLGQDFHSTPASSTGRIAAFDGTRLFSRPGPLLADTLEALVEVLHPEAQQFGHAGLNWSRVASTP